MDFLKTYTILINNMLFWFLCVHALFPNPNDVFLLSHYLFYMANSEQKKKGKSPFGRIQKSSQTNFKVKQLPTPSVILNDWKLWIIQGIFPENCSFFTIWGWMLCEAIYRLKCQHCESTRSNSTIRCQEITKSCILSTFVY